MIDVPDKRILGRDGIAVTIVGVPEDGKAARRMRIGDRVRCANDAGGMVRKHGLRLGALYTVRRVEEGWRPPQGLPGAPDTIGGLPVAFRLAVWLKEIERPPEPTMGNIPDLPFGGDRFVLATREDLDRGKGAMSRGVES